MGAQDHGTNVGKEGAVLFPAVAVSGDFVAPECAETLEQLATVKTLLPVYKFSLGGQQRYIQGSERPAEIDRLQKIVDANCSVNPQTRNNEESAAQRLHLIRSPDCNAERDKLALMGKPNSHDSPDNIAQQRQRVTERCSAVDMPVNVWLLQIFGFVPAEPMPSAPLSTAAMLQWAAF